MNANFKVQLNKKNDGDEIGSKVGIKRFKVQSNKASLFVDLKNELVSGFKELQEPNTTFRIFWRDDENDWIRIENSNDLQIAMDDMDKPVYKLCVCFENVGTDGKPAFIFVSVFTFRGLIAIKISANKVDYL